MSTRVYAYHVSLKPFCFVFNSTELEKGDLDEVFV